GVMFCSLVGAVGRVHAVAMRQMRVMAGLVMVAGLVMFRRFPMMTSGVFMVLGRSSMVVRTFMLLCAHGWLRHRVLDPLKLRSFSDRRVTMSQACGSASVQAAGLICKDGANAPASASVHCAA